MKTKLALAAVCLIPGLALAQATPLEAFDLKDVRLLPGPFKQAEQVDMNYILELDMDRLLAPFLKDAGLDPKAENYTNWENTGLDGHIGGHYLTALSLMYASTGDERMKNQLDAAVKQLKQAQEKNGNGYIGGIPNGRQVWDEIREGNIRASAFGLNDRWVPLYNIHKTYAGLRDAYLLGGNQTAKEMFLDLTDWMLDTIDDLSDAQIQDMLRSEHGGLNEVFADAAAMVREENPEKSTAYMELARRFSHRAILDPLLQQHDELTGKHANTQIPKVIGFKRIADLQNDPPWNDAAVYFWENVTGSRSISIGGNSVREHFHPIKDYSSMIDSEQGPETCNTYNMLKLTKLLFLSDPQDRYMEFYERALYNHILSTQHPEKGGFVYFTPMRPGHYRVYSQPHTCFWCCVGSGLENHAKYGEMIYAHSDEELYVNLFIPSAVRWQQKGLVLTQKTAFPDAPETVLLIEAEDPVAFTLKIRYPAWIRDGALSATVNGDPVSVEGAPGDYVSIDRTWKSGDRVEIQLPMTLEAEPLPDGSSYYSFRYGPIVLGAKTTDEKMPGLFADDSRGGHIAAGEKIPLNEMPILAGNPDDLIDSIKPVPGQPLTFRVENLYSPRYRNLELIPFFRLHDSRYIVYWRVEAAEDVEALQAALSAREAEQQQLDAMTVDLVFPGEQQPESDHFIESSNSQMGIHQGRHWRDARGWFSYILRDKEKNASKLRIMYYGGDTDRRFRILANGTAIASVDLDGSRGDTFYSVEYPIPENIREASDGAYTIRFEAEPGSVAGGIFEVRLLK